MMRKNRKTTRRMSIIAQYSMQIGALLLMLCVALIVNVFAQSKCRQLTTLIGQRETELAGLEKECDRETAKWQEMVIPERLNRALYRQGMAMYFAKPVQIIRMNSQGVPVPGQWSVEQARARGGMPQNLAGATTRPRRR